MLIFTIMYEACKWLAKILTVVMIFLWILCIPFFILHIGLAYLMYKWFIVLHNSTYPLWEQIFLWAAWCICAIMWFESAKAVNPLFIKSTDAIQEKMDKEKLRH